jgi:hypothetical protein
MIHTNRARVVLAEMLATNVTRCAPGVDPRETSPPMLATARRTRDVAARPAEPGAMGPR